MTKEYLEILNRENLILDEVCLKQDEFRKSINEKDWESLNSAIYSIETLMNDFNRLDEKREEMYEKFGTDNAESFALLGTVRTKLVKCQIENKAISNYLNITKNFIKEIINNALPQSRAKVYSSNGMLVSSAPESVLVDTLY